VTLEMAGLTEGQRQRVAADRRRSSATAAGGGLMERLAALNDQQSPLPSAAEVSGGGNSL
jgi:hypothetical protein